MRPLCRPPPTIIRTSTLPFRRHINITSFCRDSQKPASTEDDERDDYYSLLLSSPLPSSSPSASQLKPSSPLSKSVSRERKSDATEPPDVSVVFGSRLAGPAQARDRPEWATERPQEPDNCCMSGCVHCVWDLYREEMEEWAERQRKTTNWATQTGIDAGDGEQIGRRKAIEEGGGGNLDSTVERGYEGMDVRQEGLFGDVPIGIREFMNTEKRLRERKERGLKENLRRDWLAGDEPGVRGP